MLDILLGALIGTAAGTWSVFGQRGRDYDEPDLPADYWKIEEPPEDPAIVAAWEAAENTVLASGGTVCHYFWGG